MAAIVKEKLNEKNGFLEVNPVSIAVLAFLASMPYQSKRQEFPRNPSGETANSLAADAIHLIAGTYRLKILSRRQPYQ